MLVLKDFRLDENSDEFLYISGRGEGIGASILMLLGIGSTTELRCNSTSVLFKTGSLRKGQMEISIPNSAVSAVVTGFRKPVALLVVAALFLIGGIIGACMVEANENAKVTLLIVGFAVAAICTVLYYKNKTVLFGVYNGGNLPIAALLIKRSVIKGMSINFDKYQKAAVLLNKAVLGCQHQKSKESGEETKKAWKAEELVLTGH
ncbi:hypothetical protein R80B4_00302 [Fibrobacteres bacterium R8-0-B4]